MGEKSVVDIRHMLGGRLSNQRRDPACFTKHAIGYMKRNFNHGFAITRVCALLQEQQATYFIRQMTSCVQNKNKIQIQAGNRSSILSLPQISRSATNPSSAQRHEMPHAMQKDNRILSP